MKDKLKYVGALFFKNLANFLEHFIMHKTSFFRGVSCYVKTESTLGFSTYIDRHVVTRIHFLENAILDPRNLVFFLTLTNVLKKMGYRVFT